MAKHGEVTKMMTSSILVAARALLALAIVVWAGQAAAQDFRDQDLSGTTFDGFDFSGADFTGADLSDAAFLNCDLSGANLSSTRLDGTAFADSNLQGASFAGSVSQSGLTFARTELQNVIATPVLWDTAAIVASQCEGIDFTASGLVQIEISNSDCPGANFFLIDGLRGLFRGSNLTGASFEQAILTTANFESANLTNANFVNAIIDGANFRLATTDGIQF